MLSNRRAVLAGAANVLGAACAGVPDLRAAASFRAAKRFVRGADGLRMAYYQAGAGAPIVFLHGNPTSSYLWRNVIPPLTPAGRCIAPDLVGMGDSDKLPASGPGRYTFFEHARRLDALIDAVAADQPVTLVAHDWGGPLGFHWAMRHPSRVRAIAFMETFVVSQNDANTPPFALQFYSRFRTPEAEREVLDDNFFVESVLLGQLPDLSEEARAEYRRPFVEAGEARRPTLEWPRQVPINGEPAEVHAAMLQCLDFMARTPIPKLFIRGEPGALILGGRERVPRAWPAVSERVVAGRHYLPEESPGQIGRHIRAWLAGLA